MQLYFCDINNLKNNRWDSNFWRKDLLVFIDQIQKFKLPIYKLKDIAFVTIGQSGKRTFIENDDVQYLVVGNLLYTGVHYQKKIRYVEKDSFNDPVRSRIKDLDLLLAISGGGSIGKSTIVLDVDSSTNISQDIALVRLDKNQFSTLLFLQSKWGIAQIQRFENGTGITHLNQEEVREIVIPDFPESIEEWAQEKWLQLHEEHKGYTIDINKENKVKIYKKREKIISDFEKKLIPYILK